MSIADVVRKLVGPIEPVGEAHADNKRFENLEAMIDLVDRLAGDLDRVASCRDSQHGSVRRAGQRAHEFLVDLKEALES